MGVAGLSQKCSATEDRRVGNIKAETARAMWFEWTGFIPKVTRKILRCAISLATSPRTIQCFGEPFLWLAKRRSSQRWNLMQAQRVLIVRLDAIGDVVMTTPFLREVRHNLPEAWITLVVSETTINLVELCPYANEVLALGQPAPGRLMALRRLWGALKLASVHLWRRRFEVALVPRWDVDHYAASFLAYFSGAICRIGYSEKTTKLKSGVNRDYDRLYSQVFNNALLRHEVLRNLDLLRGLGAHAEDSKLEVWTCAEDAAVVDRLLEAIEPKGDQGLVALALGTSEPKKTWPLARYVQIGKWLVERWNVRVVLVGGVKEVELGNRFRKEIPSTVNLIGKLSLRQTAVLLGRCQLYIGNDTGPMHLAAAAGTPVIEISCHPLSGDAKYYTSPARFGPWGVPHRVLQPARSSGHCKAGCTALEAHCILGVQVGAVQRAVSSLLACRVRVLASEGNEARDAASNVK